MARYDRTYALAHAATLILAVGAIYYWTHMSRYRDFTEQSEKPWPGFRRGAGVCVPGAGSTPS